MNAAENRMKEMEKKWSAYRRILFVEKSEKEADRYVYRVLSTNGGSVCPVKTCTEEQVKLLPLVFSTDICNFRVVDGELKIGWSEKDFEALSELIRNIHESRQVPEVWEYPEYEPDNEAEEEENWEEEEDREEYLTVTSGAQEE